jgi:SSS family solute:Na+ symporter
MMDAYREQGWAALWWLPLPSLLSLLITAGLLSKRVKQCGYPTMPTAVNLCYGRSAKVALMLVLLLGNTTAIAAQLIAVGTLFSPLLGWPFVPSFLVVLLPVVAYCCYGGYKAVVLTDKFQLYLLAFALALLVGNSGLSLFSPEQVGQPLANRLNFSALWQTLAHGAQASEAGLSGLKAWLAAGIMGLSWSLSPEMWQRMVSAKTPQVAQRSAWLAAGMIGLLSLMVGLAVLLAWPMLLPKAQAGAPVLFQLASFLPVPLAALVMAGFLAAVTSTLDSILSVGSQTLTMDAFATLYPKASGATLQRVGILTTLLLPLPAVAIAWHFRDILSVLWLATDVYACTLLVPLAMVLLAHPAKPHRLGGRLAMLAGGAVGITLLLQKLGGATLPMPGWVTLCGVLASAVGYAIGVALSPQQTNSQLTKQN